MSSAVPISPDESKRKQCKLVEKVCSTVRRKDVKKSWRTLVQKIGAHGPWIEELEKLENEIDQLSSTEKECWSASGIEGKLDGTGIFQWVKKRVADGHSEDEQRLSQLDELRRLREKKACILQGNLPLKGPGKKMNGDKPVSALPDGSQWWCVIIGISDYPGENNALNHGCHDAMAMYEYLTSKLGIPQENIILLINDAATRERIMSTLTDHLLDNDQMKIGDRRMIYFAGHGSSYEASRWFKSPAGKSGAIEAICPIDRGSEDAKGKVIHDISDREINLFLQSVSKRWGPQTVVIMDCCYSGGTTRSTGHDSIKRASVDGDMVSRVMGPIAEGIPKMLEAIKDETHRRLALEENWVPDMTTHVLLAACEEYEQAIEIIGQGGVFTRSLLRALQEMGAEMYSWRELLENIGDLWVQSPVVAGLVNSVLWFNEGDEWSN